MLGALLEGIAMVSLALLFLLLIGNVTFRFFPVFSMGWFDEIVELCFAYLVFFGSAALWRKREHFKLDWIQRKFAGRPAGYVAQILIDLVSLGFFLVFFFYSLELTMRATDWTPIFKLPKRLLYGCMPVSGFIMTIYALKYLGENFTRLFAGARRSAGTA